jgi:hypothetical protein
MNEFPFLVSFPLKLRHQKPLVIGLIVLFFLIPFFTSVDAAIDLLYFRARPGASTIKLEWATASEFDIAGFYIVRSNSQDSGYSRVSPFIFAKAEDSLVGATYEYVDNSVSQGVLYYYKLEVVPTNISQGSEFHGPISSSIGTPFPTISNTPEPTLTSTPTPVIRTTRRPTATLMPTDTPLLLTPQTQNPVYTPTIVSETVLPYPEPSQDLSIATTDFFTSSIPVSQTVGTLVPFPEIEIEFPPTSTMDEKTIIFLEPERAQENTFSLENYWLIGVIIIIWVLLGFIIVRFLSR